MQRTTVQDLFTYWRRCDDHRGSSTPCCILSPAGADQEPVQPRGMECGNTLTFLVALSIAADLAKCRSASPRVRDRPDCANGVVGLKVLCKSSDLLADGEARAGGYSAAS